MTAAPGGGAMPRRHPVWCSVPGYRAYWLRRRSEDAGNVFLELQHTEANYKRPVGVGCLHRYTCFTHVDPELSQSGHHRWPSSCYWNDIYGWSLDPMMQWPE